jgi:hypothetical protein
MIFFFVTFFFILGGIYFGTSVGFNISNSIFKNCSANDEEGGGNGGAIFTESTITGLRYLTNLTFLDNIAGRCFDCCNLLSSFFFCSTNGSDIADVLEDIGSLFDGYYSKVSVTLCTSSSASIKFYICSEKIVLDCLLSDCGGDNFYISDSGIDYLYCGREGYECETLVCKLKV